MTKQTEVFDILQDVRLGELTEYEATLKLQELGVVIKGDELQPCVPHLGDYFTVESLVDKEVKDN